MGRTVAGQGRRAADRGRHERRRRRSPSSRTPRGADRRAYAGRLDELARSPPVPTSPARSCSSSATSSPKARSPATPAALRRTRRLRRDADVQGSEGRTPEGDHREPSRRRPRRVPRARPATGRLRSPTRVSSTTVPSSTPPSPTPRRSMTPASSSSPIRSTCRGRRQACCRRASASASAPLGPTIVYGEAEYTALTGRTTVAAAAE